MVDHLKSNFASLDCLKAYKKKRRTRWTNGMLNTVYLCVNTTATWKGWKYVASVVYHVHGREVSASSVRHAYDRYIKRKEN